MVYSRHGIPLCCLLQSDLVLILQLNLYKKQFYFKNCAFFTEKETILSASISISVPQFLRYRVYTFYCILPHVVCYGHEIDFFSKTVDLTTKRMVSCKFYWRFRIFDQIAGEKLAKI